LNVELTDNFKAAVVEAGFDPAFGARPLKRAITRMLEDTLAEQLLQDTMEDGAQDAESKPRSDAPAKDIIVDVNSDGEVVVHSRSEVVGAP